MSQRLKTGMKGRPIGTASRLTTAMRRDEGMQGGGIALQTQVKVTDRPMTQQGLTGIKTVLGGRSTRIVQDKTYFLGVIRNKVNELTIEIQRIEKEREKLEDENSNYHSYEKRAEAFAKEIKDLQGQMADYNTLVDKVNTGRDASDLVLECQELKVSNERNSKALENYFETKKDHEERIQGLEKELDQEKRMSENLVNDMSPEMRQEYLQLKDHNERLLQQLEKSKQQQDQLELRKSTLDESLVHSEVKQEAVRLHEQIYELRIKRDQLFEEENMKKSPEEERENLLQQVKRDNQEISSFERQTREIMEVMAQYQEELQNIEVDIEENQGEQNHKYKELKKREAAMQEFFDSYEDNKAADKTNLQEKEQNVIEILQHIATNLGRFESAMPDASELQSLQSNLSFKTTEMERSENTAAGLVNENDKVRMNLQKVQQLEEKVTEERRTLKEKIRTMEDDIVRYQDVDNFQELAEDRKRKYQEERVSLTKKHQALKNYVQKLSNDYNILNDQLKENETFVRLCNMERKWQQQEQNNFATKEFIATKTMESDYKVANRRVIRMLEELNKNAVESVGKGNAFAHR